MTVGDQYGWLTVVEKPRRALTAYRAYCVRVRCVCGCEKVVSVGNLSAGRIVSCGCYNQQRITKHGQSRTRLYHCLESMIRRCENPKNTGFKNYGGRGIRVCCAWHVFEKFARWALTQGYRDDLTLDRKRTDGNYQPSNCRWATRRQQAHSIRKLTRNTSGYIGVAVSRHHFRAFVRGKHLAVFDDSFSAAWVRDAYVKQHFDQHATLNNLKERRVRKQLVKLERRGTFDWKEVLSR